MQNTYFIQCNGPDGPIKVGKAVKPRMRLLSLQTANPYRLRLIAELPGSHWEKALHRLFEPHQVRGEWYEAGPVLEWLEECPESTKLVRYATIL